MINNKNSLAAFFGLLMIVGCSMEESSMEDSSDNDASSGPVVYFNEFMECKFGPDMSEENLTAMISDWQKLISSEDLTGAWGYAPAADTNSFGESGWWELQWTSKDGAEAAWSDWVSNEAATEWTEKYASVMQCDGPGRYAWDGTFPISAEENGEYPDNGYFYSEFHACNFNEGSSREDAMAFMPGFNDAVANSNYEDTSYHYGNYFAHGDAPSNPRGESANFLWANFTNSKDSNDKANASFEADVRDKMFPLFSEFASCADTPDVYHGWTLYNASEKDFMPTFTFNN